MDQLTSADGTTIAYETAGAGRPIIFAAGAFNDHTRLAPLAARLARDFLSLGYDRRARGASGDVRPYSIDREVEDLGALIAKAGGEAVVFGYSSGAILALHAAATLPISHLVLFEPPFLVGGATRKPDLPRRLDALVQDGRNGDAVELFQIEMIGMDPELVAQMRNAPFRPALDAIAQSTVYDATITTELGTITPSLVAVHKPILILNGAATWPPLAQAARELAAAMPDAQHRELADGAAHDVPVDSTADAVRNFLSQQVRR
jgi:pimeloyl-ACP methyl ester carboxylesterase